MGDNLDDGNITQAITLTTSSTDANFNLLSSDVSVTTLDDDRAGITVSATSPLSAVGAEATANTTTTNWQFGSTIASDANGNYVVTWMSLLQDGSSYGIYGQRYSADGTALGSEFQINTTTADSQANPVVGMDADGRFVVAWESNLQDGSGQGVYLRFFDADGTALTSERRANGVTAGHQFEPAIAVSDNGTVIVTWTGDDASGNGVFARIYETNGSTRSTEFLVNTTTAGTQNKSAVAADAVGNFVVTWRQSGTNTIMGQRFDANGKTLGGEFQVNTTATLSIADPAVTMTDDGRFAVAWTTSDGTTDNIAARVYDADGVAVGNDFMVNTTTADEQSKPAISSDSDGNFVVLWQSFGQDGDDFGIYGRRFDAAGTALHRENSPSTRRLLPLKIWPR